MKNMKLNPKMGFLVLAKHGLNKYGIKRPKLVSLLGERENRRERGREEKERRRKKKKKKRKSKQSQAPKRYGTTNLVYGSLVLLVNGLPQT